MCHNLILRFSEYPAPGVCRELIRVKREHEYHPDLLLSNLLVLYGKIVYLRGIVCSRPSLTENYEMHQ